MDLKELKIISEDAAPMSPQQEAKIVRGLMKGMEAKLPNECRFKSWDEDAYKRELLWVTQESTPAMGKDAAKTIAKELRKAGVKGWTVKVTIRDDYHGGDETTKWQGKAKS